MYGPYVTLWMKTFLSLLFTSFWCRRNIKSHIKDCKSNGKQRIIMLQKGERVKFKNHGRKVKSPLIIYSAFESILLPENNRKQNPEEVYTNKCERYIACSYGYKLVSTDNKFSKPFKTFLEKDAKK